MEEVPGWKLAVLVASGVESGPEVEFVEEAGEIQIQVSLGTLRHMDFPMLEQAL